MTDDNFHRQLLDNLNTAVLVAGLDLRVRFISTSAQALLEVSESRGLGVQLEELLPGQAQLLSRFQRGQLNPHTARGLQLERAGGRVLSVDCSFTPMASGGGEADTPDTLIVELHPVNPLLGAPPPAGNTQALIRGLAHEIKNPLGGLRGAAQLLAQELQDSGLAEYTRVITEESERLRDLVDRLLTPHQRPRFQPLNIHEVLEHVRTLLQAEASDIKLRREYDPSLPELHGDRAQLVQVILNILRNAMHATRDNAGPREILLRTRAQRQFTIGTRRHRLVCRIDVQDNGAGIPPQLMDAIFVPLVSGHAGGTGLGLAICQSIINQHRGMIECASQPGRTVFSLYLPLV